MPPDIRFRSETLNCSSVWLCYSLGSAVDVFLVGEGIDVTFGSLSSLHADRCVVVQVTLGTAYPELRLS